MSMSIPRLLVVAVILGASMTAGAAETESTPAAAAPTAAISDTSKPVAAAASVAAAAKPSDAPATTTSKAENGHTAPVPAGYKARVVDGETRYCRKSTPMGTRFPTEVCMTVAQYEESVRNQNGLRQELTGRQKSYSNSN